jgi:hypothetical protein
MDLCYDKNKILCILFSGRNEFFRPQFSRRQLGYQGNLPEIPEKMSAILKLNHPSESIVPRELLQNHFSKLKATADIEVDMIYKGEIPDVRAMTPEDRAVVEACKEERMYLLRVISSHVSPDKAAKFASIYDDLYRDFIRNAVEQAEKNPKYLDFLGWKSG